MLSESPGNNPKMTVFVMGFAPKATLRPSGTVPDCWSHSAGQSPERLTHAARALTLWTCLALVLHRRRRSATRECRNLRNQQSESVAACPKDVFCLPVV